MATEYVTRNGRHIEVETLESSIPPKRANPHIGCPLAWLKRVLPLVNTKEQLVVAIWLQRRRAVCCSELFTVPNQELREGLGLSQKIKYRALEHLERAGAIAVVRDGKHALRVRILP